MSGIYYALSIVAIFLVIRWFLDNDKKSPDENTTGFLAMRGVESQPKPSPRFTPTRNAAPFPNRE